MKQFIDDKLVAQLEAPEKGRTSIRDDESHKSGVPGYLLRIYDTGKFAPYLDYRVKSGDDKGKRVNYNIATNSLTLDQFNAQPQKLRADILRGWREKALAAYGAVLKGDDPSESRRIARQRALEKSAKDKHDKALKRAESAVLRAAERNTINVLCADDGDYTRKYLKMTKQPKSTQGILLSAWSDLGDTPVAQITPDEIEDIRDEWVAAGQLEMSSIDRYTTALRAFLNWCVTKKLIATNPCGSEIKKKGSKFDYNKPYKAFSIDEVKKILAEVDSGDYHDYMPTLVRVAIYTGLRRSELLTLKWTDIYNGGLNIVGSFTKSSSSHHAKLSAIATHTLESWQRRDRNVIREMGLVFDFCDGDIDKQINQVKTQWGKLMTATEIKAGIHACRHTFGATLARRGVSIHRISQLMNHSSLEITMRYAREYPDHLDDAKELDGLYEPLPEPEKQAAAK